MGQIGYLFNLIFTFPIFNALMVLYRLLDNFGLAIVVLTLIVKLILFPLTLQQLRSMKATQALQPQMAEIKKKYGKDQRAQAEAMQALYKEYGMNPLAGNCLPLLIQMPVLFGLFYALSEVLRSAKNVGDINKLLYPFIPPFTHMPNLMMNWFAWINPAWQYPLNLPDPTHILPILAALATYFQLRMSQQRNVVGASNDQMAQQMKIMQFISPAMVLFFGWNYAAGLALYWTVSSVFAMVQQYFVTGWGSAFTRPDFLSGGNKNNEASSNGNSRADKVERGKETKLLAQPEADRVVDSGPVGSKLQASPSSYGSNGSAGSGSGSSSARRRSASARRRSSNNVPKRNASRS